MKILFALGLIFFVCIVLSLTDIHEIATTENELENLMSVGRKLHKNLQKEVNVEESELGRLQRLGTESQRIVQNRERDEVNLKVYMDRMWWQGEEDQLAYQHPKELKTRALETLKRRFRERLAELEKTRQQEEEVKIVFYSPQPRTNRHGIKQSLYPHQVYDFWWTRVRDRTEEWVEWDCDGGLRCLFSSLLEPKSDENSSYDSNRIARLNQEADGFLFFPRTFRNVTERRAMLNRIGPKRKGQQYILVNIEPNIIEHQLLTGETPTKDHELDILAYITQDSDVPISYFGTYTNYTVHSFFSPIPSKRAKSEWNITSPILYLSSKCARHRDDFVKELMQYIPVDSYGACLQNKDFPKDLQEVEGGTGSHGWNVKEQLISRYKFVLSFENNLYKDYVSEKYFQPLVYGSVPVYRGAPNLLEDPHLLFPHSSIPVESFPSIKELASYLKLLDRNEKLYMDYFGWKKYGPTKQLLKNAHHFALDSTPCRICKTLKERREKTLVN